MTNAATLKPVTAQPDTFTKTVIGVVSGLLVSGIVALVSMQFSQISSMSALRSDMSNAKTQMTDMKAQMQSIDQTQRTLIDNVVSRVTRLEIEAAQMRQKLDALTR